MSYQPELGQVLSGKWKEHEVDKATSGLLAIAEAVDPDPEGFACYASHYENEVFVLRPYYWGDCECGFDERICDWEAAHPHEESCWMHKHGSLYNEIEDETQLLAAAKALGWPFDTIDGIAVYCDCGVDEAYSGWLAQNSHAPTCLEGLPNFAHKSSGLEICWYKYIGRGMSANQALSPQDWTTVLADCLGSLTEKRE